MEPIISISNLSKTYATGFQALKNINLKSTAGKSLRCSGRTARGKRRSSASSAAS